MKTGERERIDRARGLKQVPPKETREHIRDGTTQDGRWEDGGFGPVVWSLLGLTCYQVKDKEFWLDTISKRGRGRGKA